MEVQGFEIENQENGNDEDESDKERTSRYDIGRGSPCTERIDRHTAYSGLTSARLSPEKGTNQVFPKGNPESSHLNYA